MNNEKGLTLVEVLAVVALLSMIIVMLLNLTGYTRLSDQKSDKKSVALSSIETMLTEIRFRVGVLAEPRESKLQTLTNASTIINDSNYNKSEAGFTYRAEIQPAASPIFTTSCSTSQQSISLTSMVYLADEAVGSPNNYIVSITACWSD